MIKRMNCLKMSEMFENEDKLFENEDEREEMTATNNLTSCIMRFCVVVLAENTYVAKGLALLLTNLITESRN
jgi:hypothetical protein